MRTIGDWIERYLQRHPFLYDQLVQGLLNVSALARKIRPEVEKDLMKDVSEGAMIMAFKRLALSKKKTASSPSLRWNNVTVRSGLVEMALVYSPRLIELQKKLAQIQAKRPDVFINLSQGVREAGILVDQQIVPDVQKQINKIDQLAVIRDLSAITLSFSQESVHTPGIYFRLLSALAWENINLVEIISVYTELTLVFHAKDVQRAFGVIEGLGG